MGITNPWTRKSTREVYRNPWFSVREDEVVRPDGHPGIYGVISTRIATGVVALTEEHEVYLVGQYRYPLDVFSWEIPEGGSEEAETALETIQRELREETGVTAANWTQLGGELHLSNCISSEIGYVYLAEGLQLGEPEPDGTEVLEVKRVPFDEAVDMVDEGAITDVISIVAILRAERHLRRRAAT